MNKSVLLLIFSVFLVSCAEIIYKSDMSYFEKQEKILAEEKDILKTLDAYTTSCRGNSLYSVFLSSDFKGTCCHTENLDPQRCGMTKEECSLYRKEHSYDGRGICAFNYNKYLPKGTVRNDTDFKELVNIFDINSSWNFKTETNDCQQYLEYDKRMQCIEKAKDKFFELHKKILSRPLPISNIKMAKEKAKELMEKKNILNTLDLYSELYMTSYSDRNEKYEACTLRSCNSSPFISEIKVINLAENSTKISVDEEIEIIQTFAQPNIDISCFFGLNACETIRSERLLRDECILARRNNPGSSVCFFDYKRFLPKTSKIKNDEEFRYVVNIYNQLFRKEYDFSEKRYAGYCELLDEVTTAEREKCKKDAEEFIIKIVNGNAPHCRNKIPSEYKKFLKNLSSGTRALNNFVQDGINNSYMSYSKKQAGNFIISMGLSEAASKNIQAFGLANFCLMDGYEKDMK